MTDCAISKRTRKPLYAQAYRGFESHPLRQFNFHNSDLAKLSFARHPVITRTDVNIANQLQTIRPKTRSHTI